MKTTHALIAGIAALALVAGGVTYSQSGGSRGEVSALAVSPGRDVSCSGNVPDSGGFTLDCEVLSSTAQPSPAAATPTPPASSPTTAPSASATRTVPSPIPPTSTGTPTSTAIAPTATSTATRIPTATPIGGANSVAAILADSDEHTPHDGAICGTSGYSWALTSDVQGAGPNGFPQWTPWLVFNWDCNNGFTAGVTVTIQNFQGWVLANGQWVRTHTQLGWCETMNPQTNVFQGPGCNTQFGPTFNIPNGSYSVHAADGHVSLPAGTSCFLTMYQAKMSGPATNARIMADAGGDWWYDALFSIRAGGVGRYHALTTSYQWIAFSTCSAAQLAVPPPIVGW